MKKIFVLILLFVCFVYSIPKTKTIKIEVCQEDGYNCQTYVVTDVVRYEYITDFKGKKYIRVHKSYGYMTDYIVNDAFVEIKK